MFHNVAEVHAALEREGIYRDQYTDVETFLALVERKLPGLYQTGAVFRSNGDAWDGASLLLEAISEELLRLSLAGVTKHSAKDDILTIWKQQDRSGREVYARDGTPDPAVRRGMFGRALNERQPHLNSRDGYFRGRRVESDSGDETHPSNRRKAMT